MKRATPDAKPRATNRPTNRVMKALSIRHWQRFWRIAPAYLASVARREWQLTLLVLGGLAPGVAALTVWLNLALLVQTQPSPTMLRGWLLPAPLLDVLGPQGVLVGAGVVTLLIGCIGLTNAHLASIERRLGELGLLLNLGLSRMETLGLLLLEVLATGLLGSGVGVLLGLVLSRLTWPAASVYFRLNVDPTVQGVAILTGGGVGILAALLFMGFLALTAAFELPKLALPSRQQRELPNIWLKWRTSLWTTSLLGTFYAGVLVLAAGLPILPLTTTLLLTGLAIGLSGLLTSGGWLLTKLYRRLPKPAEMPLWTLAVQGLMRHPNHTAGMTLALTTGSYAVGMAALAWLDSAAALGFSAWVAGMVLLAGASLVLTGASLAALERRREFGMLMALGARSSRVWRLILLEYAIVAVGGGTLGALMALSNWVVSAGRGNGWLAVGIVLADLLGAITSAWVGAAPVLWLVTRRSPGEVLRNDRR